MQTISLRRELAEEELHRDSHELFARSVFVDPHEPLRVALEQNLFGAETRQPLDLTSRDQPVRRLTAPSHVDARRAAASAFAKSSG
jgi:hypothetical protein